MKFIKKEKFHDMRTGWPLLVKCAKFNNCKLTARLLLHFMRIVQFHVNNIFGISKGLRIKICDKIL